MAQATAIASAPHKPFYHSLYVQVLTAIAIGIALGHFYPQLGEQMKPLGDAFIKMIKMIIAPIIFCTVVHGIASMQDMKKVGRVGLKALIYFEVLTTLALIVGLIVVNTLQPGAGMNVDVKSLDTRAIQGFVAKSKEQGTVQFLMEIIPNTVVGAFASGEILQVLFFAILFAFGLQALGERGKALLNVIDQASYALFGVVGIIMKVAPIGAFGAMAFSPLITSSSTDASGAGGGSSTWTSFCACRSPTSTLITPIGRFSSAATSTSLVGLVHFCRMIRCSGPSPEGGASPPAVMITAMRSMASLAGTVRPRVSR